MRGSRFQTSLKLCFLHKRLRGTVRPCTDNRPRPILSNDGPLLHQQSGKKADIV
jgi:hypothetical protein